MLHLTDNFVSLGIDFQDKQASDCLLVEQN